MADNVNLHINKMSLVIKNRKTILEDQREQQDSKQHKSTIVWYRVVYFAFIHATAFYGIYLCFTSISWKTLLFTFIYLRILQITSSAGIHRLWSHRAYKAKLPLRVFLCIASFAAAQGNIFHWCRDHRVHHTYADTVADPHNIKRGFLFAHIGWVFVKKHPAVCAAGKTVPLDDLLADPVVRFNIKYYYPMVLLFCFILPTMTPVYFWDEKWLDALCVAGCLRAMVLYHSIFFLASIGHTFGYRPYDKNMEARESQFTDIFVPGEGSHNYHHAFPMDYRTKEYALSSNSCRFFIDLMALIGQAYDLNLSSNVVVKTKKLKKGDGSS